MGDIIINVLLNGASGKLGSAIAHLANQYHTAITAPLGHDDNPKDHIQNCDLAIDVSTASATLPLAHLASENKKPLVIGTTGHSESDYKAICELSKNIPIVFAPNFSIGANLLFQLAEVASQTLDSTFQTQITDFHHQHKKDAPSGTAKKIEEIIKLNRGDSCLDIHSLRAGDVVGEHTVIFAGPGERLEISHRATDRSIFARGALTAARWVLEQPPGLYTMQNVLGFK